MTNNKYIQKAYSVTIDVAKSPKDLFYCITHEVPAFWPEEMEGESSKLNDEFVFRTGDSHYSK
ncbi:MAG TPA: hypothetical protein VFV08_04380, partial [Puia sp.]|nr:hypothetical protein [Puia sp.]